MHNFDPNLTIPILTSEKPNKIWRKNIPITYLSKMWHLLAKKNMFLVSENPKILNTSKLPQAEKKPLNHFFLRGKEHCENRIWNLQIFPIFFLINKYLICSSLACVQLVPSYICSSSALCCFVECLIFTLFWASKKAVLFFCRQ